MANWIPITYAVTGSKEELQDLEQKILKAENEARKNNTDPNWTGVDTADLATLLGSNLKYADLMGYWNYPDAERDSLEWKSTEDGEEYVVWHITNKHWENPKTREMIEGAYKTIKIFYDAPAEDTNDKEERYFQPRVKLTNIDGLNYALGKDGTAMLNADDCITTTVFHVPEHVFHNGKRYVVTTFGDVFADPQYGSPTQAPTELEEIFFPATIKDIAAYGHELPNLKAIHFAGDIDSIGECAFYYCQQLTTVEFGGKVGCIENGAFENTGIVDIQIPDGTRVDPGAFRDAPFGNRKLMLIDLVDIIGNKNKAPMPGIVEFLREMQYRWNIRIMIWDPFSQSFLTGPVSFDKQMVSLTDNLRWIYENLGDELLRNTIVGHTCSITEDTFVKLYYYDWKNEINLSIEADGKTRHFQFNSIDEVKAFLLDFDNCAF